jgi:hypothetical protein
VATFITRKSGLTVAERVGLVLLRPAWAAVSRLCVADQLRRRRRYAYQWYQVRMASVLAR